MFANYEVYTMLSLKKMEDIDDMESGYVAYREEDTHLLSSHKTTRKNWVFGIILGSICLAVLCLL